MSIAAAVESSRAASPKPTERGDAMVAATIRGDEAYLKANKQYIDQVSEEGYTPLYVACQRCVSPALVATLLRLGAKVDAKGSDRETPLYIAVFNNNIEAAKLLLAAAANVNEENGKENETALHVAAKFGYVDLLLLLIKSGANVNARTSHAETPLFVAAKNGKHESIYHLLVNNANPNLGNEDAKTPLYIASEKRLKHCVIVLKAEMKYLKEAKAEADVELKMRRPSVMTSEEIEAKLLSARKKEQADAEANEKKQASTPADATKPSASAGKASGSGTTPLSSSSSRATPATASAVKAASPLTTATPSAANKKAAASEKPAPVEPVFERMEIIPIEIPKIVIRDHDPITGEKFGPCRTLEEVGYDEPPQIPAGVVLRPVEVVRIGGTSMMVGTGTDAPSAPKIISLLPDDDTVDYGVVLPKARKTTQ